MILLTSEGVVDESVEDEEQKVNEAHKIELEHY
jgi:hypothetical protein